MTLEWVEVSLSGYGGMEPTGTAFFEMLGLEPDNGFVENPSDSAWKSANLVLLEVQLDELKAFEEPSEEFAARVDAGLKKAAKWIMSRHRDAFDRWRALGYKAHIFIGGWVTDDQFDLDLPPEFLLACGQAGLPIQICTND